MERITDKINALPEGANYFSLEFFPPKTQMVSGFLVSITLNLIVSRASQIYNLV
jgi:hypothetical protein